MFSWQAFINKENASGPNHLVSVADMFLAISNEDPFPTSEEGQRIFTGY